MKKTILSAAAVAMIAGFTCSVSYAQGGKSQEMPHKVGLIDMAHIFKKYKKFEAHRTRLKAEIAQSDAKGKLMRDEIQALQKKLQSPVLKDDSFEKTKFRNQWIELSTRYTTYRKTEQLRFLEQEAKVYKAIYLEVTAAVAEYARFYRFTLILRYSRLGVREAKDSRTILNRMNRLVVYVRPTLDITDPVLEYLNREYKKLSGR
ncbi:MAG: OmpH family outer membrane protein [Planctomycetes bacterium]|nr:OmpH family outer membrane protein [Planctomycetota bacterium]